MNRPLFPLLVACAWALVAVPFAPASALALDRPAAANTPTHAETLASLPTGMPLVPAESYAHSGPEGNYRVRKNGATWEVATLQATSPSWAIQLIGKTTAPVSRGDTGLLRFRARLTHTLHETGQGRIRVVVQRAGGDYQRSAAAGFDLTPEWTEFFVPVRFAGNYAAQEIGVFFGFGFHAQTVEVADVSLTHYGTAVAFADLPRTRITYQGSAPDAAWRNAALARIEKIRKGDLAVFVLDANGAPVTGAEVQVEMTRHHFEFGTAAPFSLLMDQTATGDNYRRALFSIFNAVGPENDLKWPFWVGDRDTHGQHKERTLAALRWLKEREIPVRGHVLIWPGQKRLPNFINALIGTPRQSEIPGHITRHMHEIADATAGYVSEWDVLNEPYSHHELMDMFGREIMADWFKTARAALGPDVPLYFNDWGNHDIAGDPIHLRHFIDTARFIMSKGGQIDGLGLQAHIGGVPPAPETLLATLDHYQKELGLPIRVTEYDFNTDDPQLNAAYTRDFLIAYFSHPLTVGFQFWGFWEKAHWRPQAALFDAEWRETPAGTATRELLRETWWTRAAGSSDASGRYATRGFHGRYTVRARLGERLVEAEVRHLPGTRPTTVYLVLP